VGLYKIGQLCYNVSTVRTLTMTVIAPPGGSNAPRWGKEYVMRRFATVTLLVVVFILAATTIVSAQYGQYDRGYGYDRFAAAQAEYRMRRGQREMVLGDSYEGQYRQQYPAGQMPMGYGTDPCAAFLVQARGDNFKPLVYGGIAAAGTRAITRNPRLVAGVGAIGAIVGAVKNSRDKRNGREALAVCQQYLAMQQQGVGQPQGVPNYQPQELQPESGYNDRRESTMPAPLKSGPPTQADYRVDQLEAQERCMASGMETLKNGSQYPMPLRRIYADGRTQDLLTLMPNTSVCGDPVPADKAWHYEGLARVNVNGGVSAEGADLRTQATTEYGRVFAVGFPGGWMFQPPPRFEREDIIR